MAKRSAKHILDFLAKKDGGIRFKLDVDTELIPQCNKHMIDDLPGKQQETNARRWLAGVEYKSLEPWNKHTSIFNPITFFDSSCKKLLVITSGSRSYAKMLEYILELSRSGKEIRCFGVFLPACCSLEEILVEMDLKDGLDRKKSKRNLRLPC